MKRTSSLFRRRSLKSSSKKEVGNSEPSLTESQQRPAKSRGGSTPVDEAIIGEETHDRGDITTDITTISNVDDVEMDCSYMVDDSKEASSADNIAADKKKVVGGAVGSLLPKDKYYNHGTVVHLMCLEADAGKRLWNDVHDYLEEKLSASTTENENSNEKCVGDMVSKQEGDHGWNALHIASNSAPLDIIELMLSVELGSSRLVDNHGWLPLHFAVCRQNVDAAVCLASAYPAGIAQANEEDESPLEKASNVDIIAAVVRAHPQVPTKVNLLMRRNPSAFVNIINESEGWKFGDLDRYLRREEEKSVGPNAIARVTSHDSDRISAVSMHSFTSVDTVPFKEQVNNEKDNEIVYLQAKIKTLKAEKKNASRIAAEKDDLLAIIKREYTEMVNEQNKDIERLRISKRLSAKELENANIEFEMKENAMESVRMDMARNMVLMNKFGSDTSGDGYGYKEICEKLERELEEVKESLSEENKVTLKKLERANFELEKSTERLSLKGDLVEAIRREKNKELSDLRQTNSKLKNDLMKRNRDIKKLESNAFKMRTDILEAIGRIAELEEDIDERNSKRTWLSILTCRSV